MKRSALMMVGLLILLLADGCHFKPSPEDQAKIDALQIELKAVREDVSAAEQKNSALAGGLVKALVEVRLEVLKTTEALLQQRINALESGARVTISIPATQPDAKLAESLEGDIKVQEDQLKAAQVEAAQYAGGLIAAMKQATVATQEQSLAMLKSRYLAAKYGLPTLGASGSAKVSPTTVGSDVKPTASDTPEDVARGVVKVRLLRKRFAEQEYQNFIWFDIEFTATGLDKPARAIKGVFHLQDLFGESKMNLNWIIDQQLAPGSTIVEKETGFKFNQFMSEHQWARATDISNMTASFTVQSILYMDGTRKDF
jgi:hypothetical protein